jgi:hypothetical protein
VFSLLEDRGPLDPSWIIRKEYQPPLHIETRIQELELFLKDDNYNSQHVNIKAVITMYEEGVLPDVEKYGRLVHIQAGKIVPREDVDLTNLVKTPNWIEVCYTLKF